MGKVVPVLSQDKTVYSYIRQTRSRGVSPEVASAVLLLNLVREVHRTLSSSVGPALATDTVERAVGTSLETFATQTTHIV